MNNSKKSLLMSSISLLLCISMFIGSTFAWFTDSASSAGNKIHSGILKLDVELLDKATGVWNSLKEMKEPIFNYDKWEPGYMDAKVFKVQNEGNLALRWVAKFYSEYELTILADVIDVYVHPSDSEIGYPTDRNLEDYICVGNLRTFINSIEDTTYGNLEPDQESYLGIALKMREEAGNEYQGLSLGGPFDIRIYATQHTSEYDSFGNEYDKGATFDELSNTSIMATASNTLVAGADSVDFDLSHNGLYVAKVIVPASAIADTTQPVTVTFDGIKPSKEAIIDENTQAYAFDIKVTNLKDNLAGDQLVTVIVTAPNALPAMKAYHNGTLIENAVYDEVEGTITFKTANFSPYDFTAQVIEVSNLTEMREAVKQTNVELKLTKDIEIDLSTGASDRSSEHVLVSGNDTYYNAVNIDSQNIAVDLNGHHISVYCGHAYNSNKDVGALFFVNEDGSLNIVDRGNGGFIKMRSSIYAVWAPYAGTSYADIYSGAFIADSYADDLIGTPNADGTMANENSNRALIYAGFGGKMNVYGGYFLYNNTPNDDSNRNNGAFNAKDFYEGNTPLITIHEGVMLINKEYRQNPANTSQPHGSYDNYSVKLAKDCEIAEIDLIKAVTIDGKTYKTWYQVVRGITSISASAKKSVYTPNHIFTPDDFNVYAFSSNGTAGKITNFTVAMNGTTATITYTSASGTTLTTTCIVSAMNLTILDDTEGSRIKVPVVVKSGSEYTGVGFIGTGNFDVSGWANVVQNDNGKHYDYYANDNRTYTAPNGEKVTGFNNTISVTGNGNNRKASYSAGYYDLTVENALPYTTLGINCVVGCLEDAPKLMGFGCYVNNDPTTLKWNAPAVVYSDSNDGMYKHYGWNNGHSLFSIDCSSFEPGNTYTVQWVLVFEDGLSKLSEWTVKMKAASADANDKVFIDTEKPNANVIIMAGQSNMFGPAPITQSIRDQFANVNYSNVYIHYANINFNEQWNLQTYFSNSGFEKYKLGIGAQGNTYFGPEAAVAKGLATNHSGEKWFIIKYAAAGTALTSQWTSNCIVDGKTTTLTKDMLDYVQNAIDGLSNEYDVQVRSFMWMQGESDAGTKDSAQKYAAAEKNLVSTVRNAFAAYATRPIGSVAGSGISYINAGIAVNDTDNTTAQGGPNDWVYAELVNAAKISNSQWFCSVPGYNAGLSGSALAYGPLAGNSFVGTPSIPNPNQSGVIVNSIYIDTCHLLSKATAHSLDPSNPLYEDYGNDGDNTDWAHYSAGSMSELGSLFSSCMDFMIQQNG